MLFGAWSGLAAEIRSKAIAALYGHANSLAWKFQNFNLRGVSLRMLQEYVMDLGTKVLIICACFFAFSIIMGFIGKKLNE